MARAEQQRSYAGRSAEERRGDRRRRLLDAGLELFGTHGYSATTVARVVTSAGLSTRQFYEEFADRESLLVAVYDDIQTVALQAVASALDDSDGQPFAVRLPRLLHAYFDATTTDVRWAKVAFVEIVGVSQAVERHRMGTRQRWNDLLRSLLDGAADRGQIAPRNFALAASAFIGAVNGMLQDWAAAEPRPPIDDVIEELGRLVLQGIVVQSATTRN